MRNPIDLTRPRTWLIAVAILLVAILAAFLWAPALYAELVTWQTGIAALLGFGGLIAATLVGFRNVIRAQEHQADLMRERDDRLLDQQRWSAALGLRGQLQTIKADIVARREIFRRARERAASGNRSVTKDEIGLALKPMSIVSVERHLERASTLSPAVITGIYGVLQISEEARVVFPESVAKVDPLDNNQPPEISDRVVEKIDTYLAESLALIELSFKALAREIETIVARRGREVPPPVDDFDLNTMQRDDATDDG